ncbi:MAG: class E sortase [Bifidobacteriaceae bacterium]|nr:class E sortase [Bifidobacteriaceae bacterium]
MENKPDKNRQITDFESAFSEFGSNAATTAQHIAVSSHKEHTARSIFWTIFGTIAEIVLTLGIICGLYVAWIQWWTGVESERTQAAQRSSVSWSSVSSDKETTIAKAQTEGDVPVQPTKAKAGELIAEIFIPRFGQQWSRNIVEGTDLAALNEHGLGHYTDTQFPGAIGNAAFAGHRNGYGEPLGDIDKLQEGDPIIVRTQDYWYVYTFTSYKIVNPEDSYVVQPNPDNPGSAPTKRLITLTTCEPKYSTPIHRWIAFGELKYWAKTADGIPEELAQKTADGKVKFVNQGKTSVFAQLPSLIPVIQVALAVYVILFIAAAFVWRWPVRRAIREGSRRKPYWSIYGSLMRLHPGPTFVELLQVLCIIVIVVAVLFQWVFPWMTGQIPYLRDMMAYTPME